MWFPPGQTTQVLNSTVSGDRSKRYIIAGSAGRRADLYLYSPDPFVTFDLMSPSGGVLHRGSDDSLRDRFAATLSEGGPYIVTVHSGGDNARPRIAPFSLTVSVHGPRAGRLTENPAPEGRLSRYLCSNGEQFSATFFATDPPSVEFRRRHLSHIGVAVPVASGVRYMADRGVSFWTRGNEALLEWMGGSVNCMALDSGFSG
jgi:hypothetical protein